MFFFFVIAFTIIIKNIYGPSIKMWTNENIIVILQTVMI